MSKDERCADHCTMYALSEPNDPPFKGTCSHVHDIRCDACRDIETVIKQIGTEIEGAFNEDGDVFTKRKLLFEHGKAQEAKPYTHGKRIVYALLTKILPNKMC